MGQLGHETEDAAGGLITMRARWYDPGAGRFISEDPGRNGANWFEYADDAPVGNVDTDGRSGIALWAAGLWQLGNLLACMATAMTLTAKNYGDFRKAIGMATLAVNVFWVASLGFDRPDLEYGFGWTGCGLDVVATVTMELCDEKVAQSVAVAAATTEDFALLGAALSVGQDA